MSDSDTSADFFIRLNDGTSSAVEQAVNRYRDKLCELVAREMGSRLAARESPEDPVQSALASFCRGVQEHRFRIDHSGRAVAAAGDDHAAQDAEPHQDPGGG